MSRTGTVAGRRPRPGNPWASAPLRTVRANGLDVAYLELGSGPLALCLHGFPDSPFTWRHLMPQLAAAGYRAVAPFSRGYAPTSVPADGAYQLGALMADAEALHDALGADDQAVVIGHDWGASVAYAVAAHSPERWRRIVGMGVPPGDPMAAGFFDYEQLKQAFYMFLCQTQLAELAFAAGDLAVVDGLWRDWAPGYDAAEDARHAKACLRPPRSLTAVIGYQRAAFDPHLHQPRYRTREDASARQPLRPVCYLHGGADSRLGATMVPAVERWLGATGRTHVLPGLGHFLHLEDPGQVNRLILEWLDDRSVDPTCSTAAEQVLPTDAPRACVPSGRFQ